MSGRLGITLFIALLTIQAFTPLGKASDGSQVTVELYDLVIVSGGRVILGQIAQLQGEPGIVDRVKSLQIGALMKRRESRIVSVEEIKRALPEDIQASFTGSPAVEVLPAATTDQYCNVAPMLQRSFARLGGDTITVAVTCADSLTRMESKGLSPVQFRLVSTGILNPGHQVASVERRDAGGQVSRAHIPIELQLYARLAFVLKPILRGQVLRPETLSIRTVDLKTTGLAGWLYQPALVIGWEAVRHISPDSPLRWDQIRPPAVVHKGEGISLVLGSKNLQIRAAATALESGSPGQKIWVRLEDNGKRLRATVVDGGCVMAEGF